MNDDLKRVLKEGVVACLRYFYGILFEGLMRTMKNLGQDSWCPG
jgi:hypothetical protein